MNPNNFVLQSYTAAARLAASSNEANESRICPQFWDEPVRVACSSDQTGSTSSVAAPSAFALPVAFQPNSSFQFGFNFRSTAPVSQHGYVLSPSWPMAAAENFSCTPSLSDRRTPFASDTESQYNSLPQPSAQKSNFASLSEDELRNDSFPQEFWQQFAPNLGWQGSVGQNSISRKREYLSPLQNFRCSPAPVSGTGGLSEPFFGRDEQAEHCIGKRLTRNSTVCPDLGSPQGESSCAGGATKGQKSCAIAEADEPHSKRRKISLPFHLRGQPPVLPGEGSSGFPQDGDRDIPERKRQFRSYRPYPALELSCGEDGSALPPERGTAPPAAYPGLAEAPRGAATARAPRRRLVRPRRCAPAGDEASAAAAVASQQAEAAEALSAGAPLPWMWQQAATLDQAMGEDSAAAQLPDALTEFARVEARRNAIREAMPRPPAREARQQHARRPSASDGSRARWGEPAGLPARARGGGGGGSSLMMFRSQAEQLQLLEMLSQQLQSNPQLRAAHLLLSDRDFDENDYELLLSLDDGIENRKGASQELIDSMPTDVVDGSSPEGSGSRCTVCLEEPAAGQVMRVLPCSHRFHRDCIDKWLAVKASCPICLRDLK
uniref:Ring u-box superfamily isoform 2 n=2 Tax=Tetraselmis sp. GSL018 TaxID=582737 RepID=A0A061S5C4_9CHLO|mmetsp:Transcript_35919/g.85201  ORF Transcript_35919/g.85201 Transcript_35919/m.85201 type:complete len:606 (-) Transcript_35919:40-1857(-)|eukprot:CAMPEP_0177607352 /NCGR_PEP_ID=MMETSP0419_2-20121207/17871_1 /TAXON_ID=582737 /ORGANISM="Tetraselmis sp., Strain GSL018" /LENGTH=605 /DNA_ID=CAMNT_0019101927 /DNA_START=151 /DNA_END=1968 /DNA_ORIENTATION=-